MNVQIEISDQIHEHPQQFHPKPFQIFLKQKDDRCCGSQMKHCLQQKPGIMADSQ